MHRYWLRSWFNDFWQKKFRHFFGLLLYLLSICAHSIRADRLALSWCMKALRYSFISGAASLLKDILNKNFHLLDAAVSDGVTLKEAADRTIVLKWPDVQHGEVVCKGMLLIKFTKTFSYALRNLDIERLSSYFYVVLEPSWSGYADPDILAWIGKSKDIVIQSSEVQDRALMNCFPETFRAVSFGSGSWVPDYDFAPLVGDKEFDSIYIANTNPIKRVGRYIDAIKKIVLAGHVNYKGCLVCASWGESAHLIQLLVKNAGIEKNLILKFSLSKEDVILFLNKSKCNLLLSLKEGSNRSLFEAMMCNVPVISLVENIGVNKEYIGEQSGLLIPDEMLESSMLWLSKNYQSFSPRIWALENISYKKSMDRLLDILYRESVSDSLKVYKKVNAPEAFYENTHTNFPDLMKSLLMLFALAGERLDEYDLRAQLVVLENNLDEGINKLVSGHG
ncbi:MAG: glycosyltransferase [Cellvibrio sp.]|uniref:glycosyltransferase n=1 Tax=Cellvibrio sp. TaxID=1965322 RepID=UPI0031A61359